MLSLNIDVFLCPFRQRFLQVHAISDFLFVHREEIWFSNENLVKFYTQKFFFRTIFDVKIFDLCSDISIVGK